MKRTMTGQGQGWPQASNHNPALLPFSRPCLRYHSIALPSYYILQQSSNGGSGKYLSRKLVVSAASSGWLLVFVFVFGVYLYLCFGCICLCVAQHKTALLEVWGKYFRRKLVVLSSKRWSGGLQPLPAWWRPSNWTGANVGNHKYKIKSTKKYRYNKAQIWIQMKINTIQLRVYDSARTIEQVLMAATANTI